VIHKNLTHFQFGPKVTSRNPPQLDMTLFVRGTWGLRPGAPLEPIEDAIEQGFLSGDVYADDDVYRTGPLVVHSDLGDFKPKTDLLLRGTAYPPDAPATECSVRFGVGEWSKTLTVVGPRVWRPGLLLGARPTESLPFDRMPLTWENAFGGPEVAANPVGKGRGTDELPRVEYPGEPLQKKSQTLRPACFLPVSPQWEPRLAKRGKKYGKVYRKTRAPFYSEDFDWTYWNCAPEDQQLEHSLRGDEPVTFQNLHPQQHTWAVHLPGLRVRCFVKSVEGEFSEVVMHLDTLYADLEEGRLYLTWRGLCPVTELDLADMAVGLTASEPLESEPLPAEHYRKILEAFEDDPIGIKEKFPPGFVEAGEALLAAEAAALAADPLPDGSLPAWPAPPAALVPGIPAALLALGARHKAGLPLAEPVPGAPPMSAKTASGLALLAAVDPKQAEELAAKLEQAHAAAKEKIPPEQYEEWQKGMEAPVPSPTRMPKPVPPPEKLAELKALSAKLAADKQAYLDRGVDSPLLGLFDRFQRMIGSFVCPPPVFVSPITKIGEQLAGARAKLEAQAIDAPEDKQEEVEAKRAEFLAKFDELDAELAQLSAAFPISPRPPAATPPGTDYSEQDLRDRVFDGQDLRQANFTAADLSGASLAGATLSGASFAGARLVGATLLGAQLDGACLLGADLSGADLSMAMLAGADLSGAQLARATLAGASMDQALLGDAELPDADLSGATLAGATLVGANLERANLSGAHMPGAKLESARLEGAKLAGATLSDADLRFAVLGKSDLRGANLKGADLSMAQLELARADEINLEGATLGMTSFAKARLRGARLLEAKGKLANFAEADLSGALARKADLSTCSFDGAQLAHADFTHANLSQASFREVKAEGVHLVRADMRGCVAAGANLSNANLGRIQGHQSIWLDTELSGALFTHADLRASHFQGAKGSAVDFHAARLKQADFRKAEFQGATFTKADLAHANLSETQIRGSTFAAANCYRTCFLGAQVLETTFENANVTGAILDEGDLK